MASWDLNKLAKKWTNNKKIHDDVAQFTLKTKLYKRKIKRAWKKTSKEKKQAFFLMFFVLFFFIYLIIDIITS